MNIKIITFSERSQVYSLWCHLYKAVENAVEPLVTEGRSVMACGFVSGGEGAGSGIKTGWGGEVPESQEETCRGDGCCPFVSALFHST